MSHKAISLFASSGIGDLALRAAGLKVILANELVEERAELFEVNFPESEMIRGDIWAAKSKIISRTKALLNGEELDFLIATPPCQGMSKNGQGKLLAEIRAGNRPEFDPRNRLIIPTLDIVLALRPRILLFENVPEMANTLIQDESGQLIKILDYISKRLGDEYLGRAEVVEFADYGVPQRRKRLITIYTRDEVLKQNFFGTGTFIAPRTHTPVARGGLQKWLTLRDVIEGFPALEASPGVNSCEDFNSLHRIPVLDPKKFTWISHTPQGKSAFDNQCVNPDCLYQENGLHGSSKNQEGVNRSSLETPLFCGQCGQLLPRPFTEVDGVKKIMRGFTSSYKRMFWDAPAPTLTTNLSYPSSDQNVHPEQNRVLSLHEALCLHTVKDFEFRWENKDGTAVRDGLIRDSIGESVPPRGLEKLIRHLYQI